MKRGQKPELVRGRVSTAAISRSPSRWTRSRPIGMSLGPVMGEHQLKKTWTWRGKPLTEISTEKLLWAVCQDETWPPFRQACHEELQLRSMEWKKKYPRRRRWPADEQRREVRQLLVK